jgi:hypothetical protein
MATLTSYDDTVSNTLNFGTSDTPNRAQGFKIAADSVIEAIGIKGSRGNNATAGTFRVRIYEGGSTPAAGTLVADETFSRDVLPVYTLTPTMQTVTFTTPTASLTGGSTQYYLLITILTGSTNDCLRWSADNTSPSYANGSLWIGLTSGDELTAWDHNFAIYGTTGGGATPTPLRMLMGMGS